MNTLLRKTRHTILKTAGSTWLCKQAKNSTWRRRKLLILCYHGVSIKDEHEWNPELYVTRDHLRTRFYILKKEGYEVLPLREAICRLYRGTLPHRGVVLTFDDGFYNFYSVAAPLLEEFGYPATVYLTSYYCIHQGPIMNLLLQYLLWRACDHVLPESVLNNLSCRFDMQDARQRERLAQELISQVKALPGKRKDVWLEQLAEHLGFNWADIINQRKFNIMSTDEVVDIAKRGFDVQLHTHRHRTPREQSTFATEILDNRRIIKHLTGHRATHFCYPSGDADKVLLPWLEELGVESATTCLNGLASAKQNPLLLPRFVDTLLQPEFIFESWLSGIAHYFSFNSTLSNSSI